MDEFLVRLERRIREREQWSSEHDGRINELWRTQREVNRDVEKRLRAIERFRYLLVGGAMLAGGIGAAIGAALATAAMGVPS